MAHCIAKSLTVHLNIMQPPFYEAYTRLVPETDLIAALKHQLEVDFQRLAQISEEQGNTVHPPYSWSVKQALGHLIDGEVVFSYRAFRFSRADSTPLAGFEENHYVAHGYYDSRTVADILAQLKLHRQANILMLSHLPDAVWQLSGTASELPWTVLDLVKAMIGLFAIIKGLSRDAVVCRSMSTGKCKQTTMSACTS